MEKITDSLNISPDLSANQGDKYKGGVRRNSLWVMKHKKELSDTSSENLWKHFRHKIQGKEVIFEDILMNQGISFTLNFQARMPMKNGFFFLSEKSIQEISLFKFRLSFDPIFSYS